MYSGQEGCKQTLVGELEERSPLEKPRRIR